MGNKTSRIPPSTINVPTQKERIQAAAVPAAAVAPFFSFSTAATAHPVKNVPGKWVARWSTGYDWVTDPIISGPNVKKVNNPDGSQTWGPYQKTYTKSSFGQDLFTKPEKVDGVPILCRCRDIHTYMRDNQGHSDIGAQTTLMFGSNRPGCWEDSAGFSDPYGGDTFTVRVGDSAFYAYALNRGGLVGLTTGFRGFGGKKSKRRQHNKKNQTRKLR